MTLNSVMVNVARAIGPAVAGVLIVTVGSGWCFLINAVISFGFVLLSLRAHPQGRADPGSQACHRMRGQVREGFRYVGRTPLLRDALIMMALIGCLTYEFQVTLPLIAGNTFHGDAQSYGLLTACMGVGAVVGGLIAAGGAGAGAWCGWSTPPTLFGAAVLAAALAPIAGARGRAPVARGRLLGDVPLSRQRTLQLGSEPAMRGRVMSLWSVAFLGSTPIGGPLVGLIGGIFGARYALGHRWRGGAGGPRGPAFIARQRRLHGGRRRRGRWR